MKLIPYGLLMLITLLSCSKIRKQNVITVGTAIPHDDMEYTVTRCEKRNALNMNDETQITDGTFYIVSLKVANRASRGDHEWDNSIAFIVDEDSNRYECKVDLQQKLNETEPFGFKDTYVTPFQSEESTKLVFELPPSVNEPHLKVRDRILLKDFLDGSRFEKTKVKLF